MAAWRLAVALVLVVCALDPDAGRAWGTLTGGSSLSAKELADLKWILANHGVEPKIGESELEARLGAHAIHQLIVYEAYLLLKDDPAMRDGGAAFPTPEQINAWDGVDRCEQGIRQRHGTGLVPDLAPLVPSETAGAGADAELAFDAAGKLVLNSRYNVRAHYWNPWLDSGEAPSAAAANYTKLVVRLLLGRAGAEHHAHYLAHYVADALSAKHADAIMLTPEDVAALDAIGARWFAARAGLTSWLASPILDEAVQVIEARARALGPLGQAWLDRVRAHIALSGGSTILDRKPSFAMTIAPSTLKTAVACYLHDLRARPSEKAGHIEQFYTYFDPFYFNGPIFEPLMSNPSFQLCSPLSEHMQWETNPGQAALADATLRAQASVPIAARKPLLPGPPRTHYAPEWRPAPDFEALDAAVAAPAFRATMAELVKGCARRVHGPIEDARDFASEFRTALDAAIGCVFTAFRANITALRGQGWARRVGDHKGEVEIQLRLENLADRPARLTGARVAFDDPATGKRRTRAGWDATLTQAVAADGSAATELHLRVANVPAEVAIDDLYVDVRGLVDETPDRGWVRVRLARQPTRIVRNPAVGQVTVGEGAPTDLVVVFDTTSSMQSSLDAMAKNTAEAVRALQARTDDLRVAVVTFRDLEVEADRGHFQVRPFTRDVEGQLTFLTSLRAGGGGDTPEDQLEGVSRAIALWEAEGASDTRVPAKIVIVVSDAPGKSPDSRGNTIASIARRAYEVDPAHVYPIVVGEDRAALEFATAIAGATDGQVVKAESGAEVAQALTRAAATAIDHHAAEASVGARAPGWLVALGAVLLAGGCALAWLALVRDRRARRGVARVQA